jgi:hypothetical protein
MYPVHIFPPYYTKIYFSVKWCDNETLYIVSGKSLTRRKKRTRSRGLFEGAVRELTWRISVKFNVIHCNTSKLRAVIAQSVQRWDTGLTIGVLWFDSRRGLGIFLFTTSSRTALVPTQPPIQWVPGALSLRVKRLGFEADHSPPSSAEFKE